MSLLDFLMVLAVVQDGVVVLAMVRCIVDGLMEPTTIIILLLSLSTILAGWLQIKRTYKLVWYATTTYLQKKQACLERKTQQPTHMICCMILL
jgi:hypothetical protein